MLPLSYSLTASECFHNDHTSLPVVALARQDGLTDHRAAVLIHHPDQKELFDVYSIDHKKWRSRALFALCP